MHESSADRNPVERLAEEFLERRRRGEFPPLTEYVARHPECADQIRELFPALVMMERLKPAVGEATGSFIGDGQPDPGGVPERLGDFRILREVGRGGMGIVYEAVQESLGRHVALKVLPSHALINPRHLRRFLREARAAARLHHTNIVPVFGVGEGSGLHYYVMQFIAGSGLHEIIDELRRIKSGGRTAAAGITRASSSPRHFDFGPGARANHVAQTLADTGDPTPASAESSAGSSILSASHRDFARQVARVGLQVAQALGYAHAQGVLHRDIKPSNLLHDVQGTVWVADFGLAKLTTGADDLTHEGDVLGTLRYMAPERFRGEADARSDLYALGLTLYELLTLRPAFDQEDRDRLIHQVTTGVPPRPRTLNPEIPRDLETIVLKAIEHEPARRYQDAESLANDLQRFLADRPILARPVGAIERAWKWSRRKPGIAGLLAALAAAVLVGSVGIVSQWRAAVVASHIAELNAAQSLRSLDHAMRTVDTFCTQVSQEQLLDQPGMLGLRRRLLELALESYQDFLRQHEQPALGQAGGDPHLTHKLALSFMHIGMIRNEFGENVEANKALMRAKDLLKELYRANPQDLIILEQLARCCIEIEDVERLNDFEFRYITELAVNPSVPLTKALVAAEPENPEYLRLLGRSHDLDGLRWLRWRPDSYPEAQAAFERAVVAMETAGRSRPNDIEGVRFLALARAHLGLVYQLTGQHAECVETLTQALDSLGPIEQRFPKGRRIRLDRAECFVNLGIAQIDLGHYAEASAALEHAERRLVELDREDLRTADVRFWLASAKQGRGRVALARGQAASARRFLSEAISLNEESPADSRIGRDYLLLAGSYLWLGRTELQSGRPEAVPAIHAKLDGALKAVGDSIVVGYTVPQQSAAIALLRDHAQSLINSTHAATVAEQIAARRREIEAWRNRVKKHPANPDTRFEVAIGLVELADVQGRAGCPAEPLTSVAEAIPLLESLTKAEPDSRRWEQGLARAWETVGRVHARSGKLDAARDSAGKAVAIAESLDRIDPAYAYDLACSLELRTELTHSEAGTEAAMEALCRAIAAGFDNEHLLRTDPRLAALRSRPDFPATVVKRP